MSALVIDTSVAMAWCFEDEITPQTEVLLDRVAEAGAIVPALWINEVTNVLVIAERRGRLNEAQSTRFIGLLSRLPISIAPEAPSAPVLLALARGRGLTAYDAAYLWLAESRGLPLATLDEDLRQAATDAGVETIPRLASP